MEFLVHGENRYLSWLNMTMTMRYRKLVFKGKCIYSSNASSDITHLVNNSFIKF
jgi:hypothetical protein